MAIFISYSHEDKAFVDKLAANLVLRKARVWIDRWELKVGDSLVARVQDAIQASSGLLVILSKAAMQSEWCKRELTAGLLRELEERRVVVLPVRLDDCQFPIFLRDKIYADFRTNFDEGLRAVLEGIAAVTNDSLGKIEQPNSHVDWSLDWGDLDGRFCLKILLAEHVRDSQATVVTIVTVVGNEAATKRYRMFENARVDWFARQTILNLLATSAPSERLHVVLSDQRAKSVELQIHDPKLDLGYTVHIESRRLGDDNGKDIFVNLEGQLDALVKGNLEKARKPSEDEMQRIWALAAQGPTTR